MEESKTRAFRIVTQQLWAYSGMKERVSWWGAHLIMELVSPLKHHLLSKHLLRAYHPPG